jgi:hypothetical protein
VDYPRGSVIEDESVGPVRVIGPDQAVSGEDVQVGWPRRDLERPTEAAIGGVDEQASAAVGDIDVSRCFQRRADGPAGDAGTGEADRRNVQVSGIDENEQAKAWHCEYRSWSGPW